MSYALRRFCIASRSRLPPGSFRERGSTISMQKGSTLRISMPFPDTNGVFAMLFLRPRRPNVMRLNVANEPSRFT
eukprot:11319727-Alexandrium_andersonii.AAC.1